MEPALHPTVCGENNVCLTVEDTVALAEYIHKIKEVEAAVERCSLVHRSER